MSSPVAPRLHHVAITVTDVDASVSWYERVFGIAYRADAPHEGGTGKLLADDDIRAAQRTLWTDLRLVVEPGGAAAYAALMSGAVRHAPGEKTVVVVCGSNCDPATVM